MSGAHHHAPTPHHVSASAEPEDLHVRGRLLPDAQVSDLWISGGRFVEGPLSNAHTLTAGRGAELWVLPGLVDAHCHVGLDAHGAVDQATAEEQALTERGVGTLLIRDAGSPADTRWIDERPDLPHIIRAGRHIARPKRYIRNFAAEVDPADLVAEVEHQARAGDGWVKLVGDWIDRDKGDLAPLWPVEVAAEAIAKAHELGARVTAHCFDEQSVAELVSCGIDGIEHGTGMSEEVIAQMAERGVALVPTMVNLETFPDIAAAGEKKFPTYAAHMRALHARRFETMGAAVDAGVPIFAGTDAGGALAHGLIGTEIELLARLGGAEFALGAASWRARQWLGQPGVEIGAPADLVIYRADPRADISVVRSPEHVILRGRRY